MAVSRHCCIDLKMFVLALCLVQHYENLLETKSVMIVVEISATNLFAIKRILITNFVRINN